MERIGILGGTFNPVHNGHINLAKGFYERLGLDCVILMPAWLPPHKDEDGLISAKRRFEMCSLACEGLSWLKVSDLEIKRGGRSFTVDTLSELKASHETEYFLLTGADMFLTLEQWSGFSRLARLAALCAAAREKGQLAVLKSYAEKLREKFGAQCVIEDLPVIDISSTEIRQIIMSGGDAKEFLPPKVYRYIKSHGLYAGQKS
jgi:nicotinate-nucleotide adenylyltransferase